MLSPALQKLVDETKHLTANIPRVAPLPRTRTEDLRERVAPLPCVRRGRIVSADEVRKAGELRRRVSDVSARLTSAMRKVAQLDVDLNVIRKELEELS